MHFIDQTGMLSLSHCTSINLVLASFYFVHNIEEFL